MWDDHRAESLYAEASEILAADTDPRKGLDLLWELVSKYPNTHTVQNLALDDIIQHSELHGFWDDAVESCLVAARLKPGYADQYRAKAQACRLSGEGRYVEALEVRFKAETKNHIWHGSVHRFADEFAHLGARDRAWELYNSAIALAVVDGDSPHRIRQSMANLLLKENKPSTAVEILIEGVCEAEQLAPAGAPKSMTTSIRKGLRAAGLKERGLAQKIVSACKAEGKERAVQILRERVTG